jgi:hypothetical protein
VILLSIRDAKRTSAGWTVWMRCPYCAGLVPRFVLPQGSLVRTML